MENDTSKVEGILKESVNKIKNLFDKIYLDFKNSLIDSLVLEEIRKILKVIIY